MQPLMTLDVRAGSTIGTADAPADQQAVDNRGRKVRFGAMANEFVGMDVVVKEGTAGSGNSADLLFSTWESATSGSREVARINGRGNMGLGVVIPAGKLHLYEATGTKPSPTAGTIVLEHGDAGGQSSIVFKSKNNPGSDYAYIAFQDDATLGGAGETNILTISTQNDANDHIALLPSGNVGIGTSAPTAKLHVKASGGGNPGANGLIVFNESADTGQDAIMTARVNGQTSGNPFITLDVAGVTGWSVGIDNKDSQSLKFSNSLNNLAAETRVTIQRSGNVGLGTNLPNGRLHIYEATGTAVTANNGSLILEHGNSGGQSSILFKSKVNAGSDYCYISYIDSSSASGETSLLTIGTQNDADDHIALMPSGNVGIGTQTPSAKLEVNGKIRITDGSQAAGRVLTSDANGYAVWKPAEVRRDFRPYGKPSYLWDGVDGVNDKGADPQSQLSIRGTANFSKHGNFARWGNKCMFSLGNLTMEGMANDGAPGNGIYLTLPATAGVHNSLILSTIDIDRWSVFSVWLCDAAGGNPVKLMRSSNNAAIGGGAQASSYVIGPRNNVKETREHAWMTFPVTAQQVNSYISGGNL